MPALVAYEAGEDPERALNNLAVAVARLENRPLGGGSSALFTATTPGSVPASGGGTANFIRADGTWAVPPGSGGVPDGDKGDITVSGGGTVWNLDAGVVDTTELANNAVTLAKMQDIATGRFIGRTTGGTGDPELLTGTQATALLNLFTSLLQGLVPASGGGTANYLRADGTWNDPTLPTASDLYGDGSDGNVTLVANISLAQDTFYNVLDLNGFNINTNGYRLFALGGIIGTGTIGRAGLPGGNGAGGLGGAPGSALGGAALPGTGAGGSGGSGPTPGGAGSSVTLVPRGYTGTGGAGGAAGTAGGIGGTLTTQAANQGGWRLAYAAIQARTIQNTSFNAIGAGGGGGGGSSGPNVGGGGGGGGGGWVVVCAPTIAATVTITARGGAGGNGQASGNTGGGGSGMGGIAVVIIAQGNHPTTIVTGGVPGIGNGTGAAGATGSSGVALLLRSK